MTFQELIKAAWKNKTVKRDVNSEETRMFTKSNTKRVKALTFVLTALTVSAVLMQIFATVPK